MPDQDDRHSGIPTRAIHEAYLDMQRALKGYRQATDGGSQVDIESAHGDVQETVLTLYELLRPHIKHNDGVNDYWDGQPPSYTGDGEPDPEEGKGVLEVQRRKESLQIPPDKTGEFSEADSLADWHEFIGLNGTVRLTGVHVEGNVALVAYDAYQLGLRELDNWQTEYKTTEDDLGGFLGGTTEKKTERDRVKISKLRRAARELSDVAEALGALSEFDASTPRTEITDDVIEEVEEWRQESLS